MGTMLVVQKQGIQERKPKYETKLKNKQPWTKQLTNRCWTPTKRKKSQITINAGDLQQNTYRAERGQWYRMRFSGCEILGKLPSLSLTVHIYKWGKSHNSDTETVGRCLDETKMGSLPYTLHLSKFQMNKSFKHKNIKLEKYCKKIQQHFCNLKSKKHLGKIQNPETRKKKKERWTNLTT